MDVPTSIIIGAGVIGASWVFSTWLVEWFMNQTDRAADRKKLLSELEKLRTGDHRPNVEYPGR